MTSLKKAVAIVLAISAAACLHNFCLSLIADLLVPARRVRADAFTFAFFGTIVILGVAGASKLWKGWKNVFGWSTIVMAFATAQAMMATKTDPPPTFRDKLAAYVTVGVVAAVGVVVVVREFVRSREGRPRG